MPPGTLFVVATPIGNLEDMTIRALRTLREVDLIAAEDTRRTSKLLARYEIRKPMVSLREHNEHRESARLLEKLRAGQTIALVSDAGTPGISDPGAPTVRAARDAGLRVVPVPGPSAVAAALSVSGIEMTEFAFMGFPPRSGGDREEWMNRLRDEPRTVVFFESPHRLNRTLTDLRPVLGKRQIQINKEITKIHESWVVSQNDGLSNESWTDVVGEYTAVVGPKDVPQDNDDLGNCLDIFGRLVDLAGFSDEEAVQMTAASTEMTKASVRKAVKKARISARQRAASTA
jgi:16S rRNA (cytidine1402-2'-O)-methyltransferase